MCYPDSGMVYIKKKCCLSKRVACVAASADFVSDFLSGVCNIIVIKMY